MSLLERLAHNNAWANLRLHRAVGALEVAAYRATRTSFFPSIHQNLTHILFVDEYYVDGLVAGGRGADVWIGLEAFERDGSFAELARRQREVDLVLVRAAATIDPATPVRLQRRDHVQVDRADSVLLHLYQHQIHHRGQVHAMLSGTSVAPPQLDEFFLADELPLRAAELAELGLPAR